jgi:hypothetical protein
VHINHRAKLHLPLQVALGALADELGKRNSRASDVPVFVNIEWRQFINVTLIDTPGIDDAQQIVANIARASHRSPPTLCLVLCAVCSVRCAVCGVRCAVCGVRCAVCSVRCAVCGVRCAVCGVRCAVCGVRCAVCGVRCAVCGALCAVCVRCAVCGVLCAVIFVF